MTDNFSLDLIDVRKVVPEDINFIYATWLPGLHYGNALFKCIHPDLFYKKYRKVIDSILRKPNVFVKVACLKDDPDVILGYAILESNEVGLVLHWVFTRPVWRTMGIAKHMLPTDIVAHTHLTTIGKSLRPRGWVFDPFLL